MLPGVQPRTAGWLFVLAFLGGTGALRGQTRVPRSDVAPTLRFTLPFQSYSLVNAGQRTEYVGLGLAGTILVEGTWSIEAGLGVKGGGEFVTPFVFGRFGVTPTLVDSGDIEGGWSINAGPSLGYEAQWRSGRRQDREVQERVQAVTSSLGVDVVRWSTDGNGINIQLRAGLILPLSREEDAHWSEYVAQSDDFHYALDIGGSVGWSF